MMKQFKSKKVSIMVCIFSLSMIMAKSQIPAGPFVIRNWTGCSIDIRWHVMDALASPCSSVCLGSTGILTLASNQGITISPAAIAASCNPAACNVVVTFIGAGGGWFSSPYYIDTSTGTVNVTETDCTAAAYTFTLIGNNNVIYIQ